MKITIVLQDKIIIGECVKQVHVPETGTGHVTRSLAQHRAIAYAARAAATADCEPCTQCPETHPALAHAFPPVPSPVNIEPAALMTLDSPCAVGDTVQLNIKISSIMDRND